MFMKHNIFPLVGQSKENSDVTEAQLRWEWILEDYQVIKHHPA